MRRLMAKCDAKVQADRILQGSERSKCLSVHTFLFCFFFIKIHSVSLKDFVCN